jgi:hypothetical protein
MKYLSPLNNQRCTIISEFLQLGFGGISAFYNVCKSLDVTLSGLLLIQFYKGQSYDAKFLSKIEAILEILKYE